MSSQKPVRRSQVTARSLGDECLLHDETEGSIHVVNPAAELVWNLCDGDHSLQDIEAEIRTTYAVPGSADVKRDLETIIERFDKLGILAR